MSLTIGVTGHRILMEEDKIVAGIDRALDSVERRDSRRPLVGLSALAEGADRLVAERILARPGARLHAVLPLPRDDYAADFASESSRRRFRELLALTEEVLELPARSSRAGAYEAVGLYLLDHCDVVLAVWDGGRAQGRGGTGAVATRALERGLPVAWVLAGNRRPGTLEPTTLGAEQGALTLANF